MDILWVDFALPYLLKDANYPVGGWAVELRSWLAGAEITGNPAGVLTWAGARDFVDRELPFELVETYDPEKGVKYLKYFYSYVPAMQKAVERTNPDVIIQACASMLTGMTAFVAHRAGIPFVYRVANDMDVDERYRTRLKFYEQKAYLYGLKKSDLILCQNKYQFEAVSEKYPRKRSALIPNPFATLEEVKSSSPGTRDYIAWLGVFQHQKNLPLLAETAASLPGVKFKVAGTRGSIVDPATERALTELEALPNVDLVGYLGRKDVFFFLGNAVALLNTSHYEGFSNTYLESFSVGTPVIAPMNADPDAIIARNNLGRAVADGAHFVSAIEEIMGLGGSYEDLSSRCRTYLRENHDPEKLTRLLIENLKPLIDAR